MIELIAFTLYAVQVGDLTRAKQEWQVTDEWIKDTWRRLAENVIAAYGS